MRTGKQQKQYEASKRWREKHKENYNAMKRNYYQLNKKSILEGHKRRRIQSKPQRIRQRIFHLQKELEELNKTENGK